MGGYVPEIYNQYQQFDNGIQGKKEVHALIIQARLNHAILFFPCI